MLTFDRYLFKKILISTLIGVIFMSSLALSAQLIKEMKDLFALDSGGLSVLLQFLVLTFPYMLTYMLPWAFLTAALLTLNSFSSHNEIISIRMTGQNHLRIAFPIIVLGLCFSGLLYYTSGSVTPESRFKMTELLSPTKVQDGTVKLTPQFLSKSLGDGFQVVADEIEANQIAGLHIFEINPETERTSTYIYAKTSELGQDAKGSISIDSRKVYIETKNNKSNLPEPVLAERVFPLLIPFEERKKSSRAKHQSNKNIIDYLQNTDNQQDKPKVQEERMDYFSELCTRISMSISCLSFSLIAFPLGLQSKRKQNNRGFVWGIITVGAFLGSLEFLSKQGDDFLLRGLAIFSPHLIIIAITIFLFRKIRIG